MILHIKYLSILFFGIAFTLQAQNPHPAWRNYNTDHGLPSSEVHCILQDSKGYMWFGTNNGLSRFDGYEFKNFSAQEGLRDNMVFYLDEDHQGRLWLGTMNSNIYYYEKDSIYPYSYNHIIQQYKGQFLQQGGEFYITPDGTLYTPLPLLGILQIQADGIFHLYQSKTPRGLMVMDFGEKILSQALEILPEQIKDYEKNYLEKGIFPSVEFYRDSNFSIIQGFSHDNASSHAYNLVSKVGPDLYLIGRSSSHYLVQNNEIVWQGEFDSRLTGINKNFLLAKEGTIFQGFNQGKGGLREYHNLDTFKKGEYNLFLKGSFISCVYQDKKGGIWVSTLENGVFYSPDIDLDIYDKSSGLPMDNVIELALKNDYDVFVGLRNGEVFKLEGMTNQVHKIQKLGTGDFIYDMLYDQYRETLLVSFGHLIFRKNGFTRKIPYILSDGGTSYAAGQRITTHKDSPFLWAATPRGFSKIDLNNMEFRFHTFYNKRFSERTRVVFEDLQNRVWVGTLNGLSEFKEDSLVVPVTNHPAFSLRVEDIAQLSDSTLVVSTKGAGIILWKNEQIRQITTADGLTTNMIENVFVDERDNIWVGTLAGLNKVERWTNDSIWVKQFTVRHGMPSNEINRVKVLKGQVWVATDKGLVHFEDNKTEREPGASPLIEKIFVNNNPFNLQQNFQFSHLDNNLIFHYLTLDHSQNGKVPYRYRLTPTQKNWTLTLVRSANFSALINGKYTFEVQSQNEDGLWSASTTLDFEIHPPFWETAWFLSLVAILLGFIAYRLYKYRTNQIRHEAEVVKQMADLERSALRAQMNPHFIFNCLTSISSFINKGDKASANHYLVTFANLTRAALSHSMTNKVSLEDELQLLENYLKMEQLRFENRFDYHIELGQNVEPFDIDIPPMMVQPFVENAIIHGLAKKKEPGMINLLFELQNGYLNITIADNGVGIEQSQKQKKARDVLRQSVGMIITQKRLELINASNDIRVEELKGKDGEVAGTQVVLKILVD